MRSRVNLLVMQHARGLSVDGTIIERALRGLPVSLTKHRISIPDATAIDLLSEAASIAINRLALAEVNIHIEDFKTRWARTARKNWWIPNQEWVRFPVESFREHVDLVLCKTHESQNIFDRIGFSTVHIGFSTLDRYDASVAREIRALHVAGTSPHKGTHSVISAWKANPDWPTLDLVWSSSQTASVILPHNVVLHRGPISDRSLQFLQNRAQIHVCPSAVEGFGHTLVEGMSCAALVIATDAPPMNELVQPDRGLLVPWERSESVGLGTAYRVSASDIARAVNRALGMTASTFQSVGEQARTWFLSNHKTFEERFRRLISPRVVALPQEHSN